MFGTSPEPVPRSLAEPRAGRERGPAEGPRRERLGIAGLPALRTPLPALAAGSRRVQVCDAPNGGHRNRPAPFSALKPKCSSSKLIPWGGGMTAPSSRPALLGATNLVVQVEKRGRHWSPHAVVLTQR